MPYRAYYADAVAWAVEYGITNGTAPGLFSPRADLHARADRYLPLPRSRRRVGGLRDLRRHQTPCGIQRRGDSGADHKMEMFELCYAIFFHFIFSNATGSNPFFISRSSAASYICRFAGTGIRYSAGWMRSFSTAALRYRSCFTPAFRIYRDTADNRKYHRNGNRCHCRRCCGTGDPGRLLAEMQQYHRDHLPSPCDDHGVLHDHSFLVDLPAFDGICHKKR